MKTLSLLTLSLLLVLSCAEHRDVELLQDPNGERISKSPFLGVGERSSWISKVTVVKTSTNGGFVFTGLQSDAKAGHFEFTKSKLRFLNDVKTYEKSSDAAAQELINEWDITHFDVKLAEVDGRTTNKEEEDKDIPWNEKRYFKIKFNEAKITEAATFPYYIDTATKTECWNKKTSYLADDSLDISPDYISFVVGVDYQQDSLCTDSIRRWAKRDFVYSVHYRYSFKKLTDSTYQPYVYKGENDEVMKQYGFFQTVREVIHPETGRYHNLILMNRWNPEKEHDFYFSKDFPEEYKGMFTDPQKGIFAKTNKLLEKQGLKIRFHIRENTYGDSQVKEYGDIRYSFVKFIPEMDDSAPFGYGPSDANPFTGEIVSANLHIWTALLKYYLKRVKDSFDGKETKFEDSSLVIRMKDTLKEADLTKWVNVLNTTQGAGKALNDLLPKLTFGYPGWARFTTHETEEKPLFNFMSDNMIGRFFQDDLAFKRIQSAKDHARKAIDHIHHEMKHHRNTTIYPITDVLANAMNLALEGVTDKDIIDTIVYRTSIHEFGHNIGLRHNFYGSADKKNFRIPVPIEKNGKKVESRTTTVMEYMSLEDEVYLEHDWEPYDEAALSFGYSGGKLNPGKGKNLLYCTDEHRPTNALCNHWDYGSSPSEIVMSLIKRYENLYRVINYRNNRAYWDTSGYESKMFNTMWDIKRFLLFWRAAFNEDTIRRELEALGNLHSADIKAYTQELSSDIKQAQKLSVAFYNAVVQQSSADRPYLTKYEPFSGEKKRIGILYDKIYAMMFLMGDDTFVYNPNRHLSYATYLAYNDEPELREILDTVYENALTERVDMEPWFIGFARTLYALNATNVYNRDDITKINKIKLVRFTQQELNNLFGIKMEGDTKILTLEKSDHPYFRPPDVVGVTHINGRYYMVSKFRNPYAFDIIHTIMEAIRFGNSTVTAKADLLELYQLYKIVRGDKEN